jgi:hypothetical protein
MVTLVLSQEDIMRLEGIDMDRDEQEALAFLRERVLPEIRRQKASKMQGHLDGGNASAF